MASIKSPAKATATPQFMIRREAIQALKLGTKIITVRVGKAGLTKDFSVHEELIRASSPFFEAALGRDWKEAAKRLVTLPDDEPETFGIYMQWLYCGQIFSQVEGDKGALMAGVQPDSEWGRLGQAYVVGDKLQDTDFKDCIVDALMEKAVKEQSDYPGLGRCIYTHSVDNSPVRKLAVEVALRWRTATLETYCNRQKQNDPSIHVGFTADLMLALFKRTQAERGSPNPYWSDPCRYHEHTALNKPCHKKKRGLMS